MMMIKVGDRLPQATLWELPPPGTDCDLPELVSFDASQACVDKTIILVGVTSAFTQTCTQQHIPGYLELSSHFFALGVDEIWCVAVNDAYVMSAWGKSLGINGQIRMLSDGNAGLSMAMGLTRDLSAKGMNIRSQRYSMLLVDGEVKILNLEPEGKYVVSDAQQLYIQLQGVLDKN